MNNLTNLESSIDPDKSKNIIKLALDLTQKNAIDILFKYLKDNPQQIIRNVLSAENRDTIATEGGSILLHDRPQTAQVLNDIISSLRQQGYGFAMTADFRR